MVRLGPPDESRSLGVTPGDFRAPAGSETAHGSRSWRPAGPQRDRRRGKPARRRPDPPGVGERGDGAGPLAVRHAPGLEQPPEENRLLYDGVEIVGTDGGNRTRVTTDPFVAFFWSPDGQSLAYITLDRAEQNFVWNRRQRLARQNPRRLTTSFPTEEQIRLLAFLDEYAISHGLWSPDSQSLLYAASPSEERRGIPTGAHGSVFAIPVDGSAGDVVVSGDLVSMPVVSPVTLAQMMALLGLRRTPSLRPRRDHASAVCQ